MIRATFQVSVLTTTMAAFVLPSVACASAAGATAQGSAQAEVVSPLVVVSEADLAFGAVFAADRQGAVKIEAGGGISYEGGAQAACLPGACGAAHPARFRVKGEAGRAYVVSLPRLIVATGTTTDGSNRSAPPLSVVDLTIDFATQPGGGLLDPSGQDRFEVGGTLRLPPGLPPAAYRATVPVIVTYS